MWSGRFSEQVNAEFEQWQRSFPFDRILLPHEVTASKAHAAALAKAGVIDSAELSLTLKALDQIASEGIPTDDDRSIEDVHHYVEKRLVEIAGEVGLKLHTGRSRNEQIATDLRLYVRTKIDDISLLLVELASEFVSQAEKAGDAAMPSYTHLQRAEPVLVEHWLLAYVEMLVRDLSRLADCRKRLNLCPLGSGAVAGTVLPLDRAGIAEALEFDAPTTNSIDATSDRDFAIEFVQALSSVALHLSRWAEEFILFATTEYGFVKLPEAFSTGSSAMPQKKNPDALELIRGKAARVFADATALVMTVKGLPLAYNKDMQETQQPVFAAAQQVASMVRVADGLHGERDVRLRAHAGSRDRRIHECAGRSSLPGSQRHSISCSAREDRQGCPGLRGQRLRARASLARRLCELRHHGRCAVLRGIAVAAGAGHP